METNDKNENNLYQNQIIKRTKIIKIKKKIKILKNKKEIKFERENENENKKPDNDITENKGDIILNNINNDSKSKNEIMCYEEGGERERERERETKVMVRKKEFLITKQMIKFWIILIQN